MFKSSTYLICGTGGGQIYPDEFADCQKITSILKKHLYIHRVFTVLKSKIEVLLGNYKSE